MVERLFPDRTLMKIKSVLIQCRRLSSRSWDQCPSEMSVPYTVRVRSKNGKLIDIPVCRDCSWDVINFGKKWIAVTIRSNFDYYVREDL